MTNTDLRYLYWDYNKRYFKGKLPNCKVRFKKLKDPFLGVTWTQKGKKPQIFLNPLFKRWPCITHLTLLHEMVHVSLPLRIDHGKRFQAEMLRLAKKGAFKGKW